MTDVLICMRLSHMFRLHPKQIEVPCSRCGEVCGVYPSGQLAMKAIKLEVVCHICNPPGADAQLVPGAQIEPYQSREKS